MSRPRIYGCGTDAGYVRHRKAGEDPCTPCRKAHAAKQLPYDRASRRARAQLAREYPARYLALLTKYLEAG